MGRLIDADAFEEFIRKNCTDSLVDLWCELVRRQPTAYDPNKIVEQLKERTAFLNDCAKYGNETAEQQDKSYSTMMMYEVKDLVDDLIEIVKAGGTDAEH